MCTRAPCVDERVDAVGVCLFAGGCVRDMLLGKRSADYDIATDANPRQVKKLFRSYYPIAVDAENKDEWTNVIRPLLDELSDGS